MTIYYDDPKDIEHQRTVEQAKDLRLNSASEALGGSSAVIGSWLISDINKALEKPSVVGRFISGFALIWGAIDFVKAWSTNRQAHDLELKAARDIEPKHVLLTPSTGIDIIPEAFHKVEDAKPKFLADIEPKTHQDYAAQTSIIERS